MPKYGPKPKNPIERFMAKVIKRGPDECWGWTGTKCNRGYGRFMVESPQEKMAASRAAWLLFKGPVDEGLHVLHRCDNPECTNLKHLFLGSHADNMKDKRDKGRHKYVAHKGVTNGNAKLDADKVREIRELVKQGHRHADIAAKYGIASSNVSHIANRKAWKHVD